MDRSDPELLRNYNQAARQSLERLKKPHSAKVLALCQPGSFDAERVMILSGKFF
jgi:hypothetical protein